MGIIFGVVVGKEIFGGTGRNFLNPALTARAFLYFNNAPQISGDKVWTAAKVASDGGVDGYSGATALGLAWTIDDQRCRSISKCDGSRRRQSP